MNRISSLTNVHYGARGDSMHLKSRMILDTCKLHPSLHNEPPTANVLHAIDLLRAVCWDLIISAADYISWRCVSGPGPCIYPVAALILLYHLFMYSESRWFDICLGCSFLFSRTVRAHCSPQFFYRELRWATAASKLCYYKYSKCCNKSTTICVNFAAIAVSLIIYICTVMLQLL